MTTDNTLQQFEEKMLKQVSPLEKKSIELLAKATKQTVKDNGSLALAIAVKKEIKAHSTLIKDSRMSLTRPLDDMKKLIMAKEDEVTAPLDKAQTTIKDKILAYEEELERIALVEENRMTEVFNSIEVAVYKLETIAETDAKGKEVKQNFAKLSEADQNNARVKLVFRQSIDALTTHRSNLEEEERQRIERERLAKLAEKQNAAQAQLERQKAAQEAEERRLQAEADRQKRELERQTFEAEALEQRKAEQATNKEKPKSNIATVTEFEIENPFAVDRKYCSPDNVKIRQAIKDGETDIAGVRIFQTKKVR